MSQLIVRYNRLRAANKADTWPTEVSFWWTPDGKVRMHKRGRFERSDKWFTDFDEAVPVIQAVLDTGAYRHYQALAQNPYDNALFKTHEPPKVLAVAP
jgi:hypothetical protein